MWDIDKYKNLPREGLFKEKYGIPQEKRILLYVGRIDKSKGIDLLIKAYNDLIQKNKSLILVIAGLDTGYKKELLKIISDKDINVGTLKLAAMIENRFLLSFMTSSISLIFCVRWFRAIFFSASLMETGSIS